MKLIYPRFKFFSQRLVLQNINDIKLDRFYDHEHFIKLRTHISTHGLLCPLVIDQKNNVISGQHRLRVLQHLKLGSITLCYKTPRKLEQIFFTEFNKKIFQMWKTDCVTPELSFLFEPAFARYAAIARQLLSEPVRK